MKHLKSFRVILSGLFVITLITLSNAVDTRDTRLLRLPAISAEYIAFVYDNDIWLTNRNGQNTRRITTAEGVESHPHFSPDGSLLAFSGYYDGNVDVYIMPVSGGSPTRLTWHPADDIVQGFTSDGKVLFQSQRDVYTRRHVHLFALSVNGGFPEKIPVPDGDDAQISPDGKKITYCTMPPGIRRVLRQWKNYRGGTVSHIWIMNMEDYNIEEIPQPPTHCNDLNPMWLYEKVYFVSDRNGEFNLFSFDPKGEEVTQLTNYTDFPVLNANSGAGMVIYEYMGYLYLFDPNVGRSTRLKISVGADLRESRPRYVNDKKYVRNLSLSPKANRVAFEYRGEIITVPAEKGDARNITQSTSAHDRSPVWSPDGSKIAWFSDLEGEYALHIINQDGSGKEQIIKIQGAGFYEDPKWSFNGKYISFRDNSLTLFILEIGSGKIIKIDQEPVYSPIVTMSHNWSPDSKWLVYTVNAHGLIQKVNLYSLEKKKSYNVTDGMSEASEPVFDPQGKYLYLLGSSNAGPIKDWFSQWIFDMTVKQTVYVVTLDKDAPSPIAPQSDEVEIEEGNDENSKNDKKEKQEDVNVKIDFDGLQDRIVALPIPVATIRNLQIGKSGELFYLKKAEAIGFDVFNSKSILQKFTLEKRESETLVEDVKDYRISRDGEKLIYHKEGDWYISTTSKVEEGKGKVPVDKISVYIDPKQEWRQIAREAWRINRDYFYATNYHGLDWYVVWKKYEPFLEHAATRSDVERIIIWMASELSVGHSYSAPGETIEDPKKISVGLLGADYEINNERYRFKKVFGGLYWRPELRSPLKTAGVNVKEGEYLHSVDGQPIKPPENIYKFFQNKAEKQVKITIGPYPDDRNTRTVTVVPLENEGMLRWVDWVENNIRKVDKATNGRVAYVHVPNTAEEGHDYFKRYFYPQSHKDAIIIDERYNGGGLFPDYYIDILRRSYVANWHMRYGKDLVTPRGAVFGPKVMLIDENAGSGGDLLPWMFRKFELGPLVGKRTWGGLVGILGFPVLMDGGWVTAPNLAIWNEEGWIVENKGVAPDIEVEQWPKAVNAGHDPQLEKAIDVILALLKENPPKKMESPPFPVKVRR